MKLLLDLIAGARPNFMRSAPIIDALKIAQTRGCRLTYRVIHTGQHYDRATSGRFFLETRHSGTGHQSGGELEHRRRRRKILTQEGEGT
jgi:UDP-N-acetylglucosamine 2-epimerase